MRWYDRYPELRRQLDGIKEMEEERRDYLIQGIMRLIKEHHPSLLEEFVIHFPLEINRRRWYDRDPYLWLVINGLQYASADLLTKVTAFLEQEEHKPS